MAELRRIIVHGFPGLYGGAATELHHQIILWRLMQVEVHLIPTDPNAEAEPLYQEMIDRGVTVHGPNDWSGVERGDPVIGFCNAAFLERLPEIREKTHRTIFVNCMTWLFDKEKQRMAEGLIAMFLYQNEQVMMAHRPQLTAINADDSIKFHTFRPYFVADKFPFVKNRSQNEYFGCGRISRQDADKFSASTLHIYEYFVSPRLKRAIFLGFDERSESKIGTPFDWIRTARDHSVISQSDFYNHCEVVIQPTDTTENWPRIGLEAMASGSVLIVDNRGGWRQMVDHGKTGWLCNSEREFIYYASRMAFEPELLAELASNAKQRVDEIAGFDSSKSSWEEVFESITSLPE